ncbi:hypothetical protein AVEN_60187-1 [Araneus ventricosus]|uniref:Uncharacterized protein n=1 Tax=Araneus ventricosus TaxID=182803 RepID=A0A4Y2CMQ0_ARAVE|nr:hypothetical protein AVEN_60187-1 [Araneus ventricosus]
MTRTIPELAHLTPNFSISPAEGRMTHDVIFVVLRARIHRAPPHVPVPEAITASPHAQRICSGIWLRTWIPPALKPRPYQ